MLKIELTLPDFAEKFRSMMPEITTVLAATMQTNRAMMFDKDGADNGKPSWAPPKWREGGRPLQNTGTLRKSFAPQNDGITPGHGRDGIVRIEGTKAVIGTKLVYAGMMNDGTTKMPGGVLKAKQAQALRFPAPPGSDDKFMFRKSVKIPARQMDLITAEDEAEFADTLANYIAGRLNE